MIVIRSRGRQSKCIADADASLQSCSRARAALAERSTTKKLRDAKTSIGAIVKEYVRSLLQMR